METQVSLEVNDKNGYFHIDIDSKTEAKMTFVFAGSDKIIIDHTEVNEGYNGKGFGKMMVEKADVLVGVLFSNFLVFFVK